MKEYQTKFIDLLVASQVLRFGEFTTKAGRKSPYFLNFGEFHSGSQIAQLGEIFAAHIVSQNYTEVDVIFGPAYKGIPLAVATASALAISHNIDVGYAFDRKEEKQHGDRGKIVGAKLDSSTRLLFVEDVISAGTTFRKIVPELREDFGIAVMGIIVAVDRSERGSGPRSACKELQESLSLEISPIVTIHDILTYLSKENASGFILSEEQSSAIQEYLERYGEK